MSGKRRGKGLFFAALAVAAGAALVLRHATPSERPESTPATAVQSAGLPPAAAFAPVGGLPVENPPRAFVEHLINAGYAVDYDEDLMDPLFAAYYCGPRSGFPAGDRDKLSFVPDDRLPVRSRLKSTDFRNGTGGPRYDRGHMAPNHAIATRYGPAAQAETFRLSNIVPQRSELNQTLWRLIEERISDRYAPEFSGVWVVVGPVFGPESVRFNGKAAIPDAFFCIVLDREESTGRLRALALLVPQTEKGNQPPAHFETTIREIEKRTGLDFFSGLPDPEEDALETSRADGAWEADSPR